MAALILVFWLVLSSILLFRFGGEYYGEFDQKQLWLGQSSTLSITDLKLPQQSGWQLVHILPANCGCSRLASPHVRQLSDKFQLTAAQQFFGSAEEVAAAGLILPAVPAVLVFANGQLQYAGPYASGPLCSSRDSFIEALLAGEVTLPGSWLNGETKACRCLVSQSPK